MLQRLAVIVALSLVSSSVLAQPEGRRPGRPPRPPESAAADKPESPKPDDAKGEKDKDGKDKKPPEPVTSHHEVTIGGSTVGYTATAGYLRLPDYDGKPKADVFFVSYIKDSGKEGDAKAPDSEKDAAPAAAPTTRPITFCFNGGPGSSSVWLHLGAIGPRRVKIVDKDEKPGQPAWPLPPYSMVDNEFSWLDLTDLVFIDPVSTGYSRPVEGEHGEQFHGLQEDIQWVGDFIRLWTTKNKRWESPKYLAGESYGTTRAAGLSGYLQDQQGMNLSGIVLVSPVLNFQTIEFDTGNDTPYWLFLPTYTATAWYHQKLAPELQRDLAATLREAEAWAQSDYLVALGKGDGLSAEERTQVVTKLARYTGLSPDYVRASRLRISIWGFTKELLRSEGKTLGRYDARYTGTDRADIGTSPEYDPSYAAVQGAFTATFNQYVRGELNYENDKVYEILTGRVHPWSFDGANNRYAEVAETLRGSMTKNPALRVLICSGYFDLATPYFAAGYTIRHLDLAPETRGHIGQAFFGAGHMMYLRYDDLKKLKADVMKFYGDEPAPK